MKFGAPGCNVNWRVRKVAPSQAKDKEASEGKYERGLSLRGRAGSVAKAT